MLLEDYEAQITERLMRDIQGVILVDDSRRVKKLRATVAAMEVMVQRKSR